jgi:hypothetical protein
VPDRVEELVESLPGLKSVTGVWEAAQRRLRDGDAVFLGDLGVALVRRFGTDDTVWQYRSVFDQLLRLLAVTAGSRNVAQALRLIAAARSAGRGLDRYGASLLAAGQSSTDLTSVFAGGGSASASEELRACLVHELVLRGVAVSELPGVARWAASPHWRHHPLGWLPLELSVIEESRGLPDYGVRGSSHALPFGPLSRQGEPVSADGPGLTGATEVTTDAVAASIASAVMNWTEGSNGRIEARVFDLAHRIDAEAVPDALLTIGLACLDGRKSTSAFSVSACTVAQTWRVLFAAASTGGAYNSGCFGAYGRLFAWRSLAGLCGAAEGASAAEVAARATACTWYGFDADSPWFEQVAWDIGLAAVDSATPRLAMLAATDTD